MGKRKATKLGGQI